jgi:putative NADPH-quinone reductase
LAIAKEDAMPNTLILLFHPTYAASNANRALCGGGQRACPAPAIVDMQALYPDSVIDADVEVARLLAAERIVLQFPCSGIRRRRCSRPGRTRC